MCLLLIAIESHPVYKLVLAANRDEYYDRQTAPACFWDDPTALLAGRDLREGGTWLGVTTKGKIAGITNYRDPASKIDFAPSRGMLTVNFLKGNLSPADYFDSLARKANKYNGFNLILGDINGMFWYSNRAGRVRRLSAGIWGLSNHLLDTQWPKVTRAKKAFEKQLLEKGEFSPETTFQILFDQSVADDCDLPDTGVKLEWERVLSSIFISSPTYGTRSSTLLLIDRHDHVTFIERSYNSMPDKAKTVRYEFPVEY